MRLEKVFKKLGPVVAMAIATGIAARGNAECRVNGGKGEPLDDLDLTGDAPTEVALLGPDAVEIRAGEALTIEVEGDPEVADSLRFVRDDTSLTIMRASGQGEGTARVIVTMPSPRKLTIGGSGAIDAAELTGDAEMAVLGSGWLEVAGVSGDALAVTIAGSGSAKAGGRTDKLDLDILGSGSARLDMLEVGQAHVTVAGSGDAAFRSDGDVEGEILGSGNVTIRGDARCKVRTVGSGSLVCERKPAEAA